MPWLKMLVKKNKGEDEIFYQGALMDAYKELKCGWCLVAVQQ